MVSFPANCLDELGNSQKKTYSLISKLCVLAKLFERIISDQLEGIFRIKYYFISVPIWF